MTCLKQMDCWKALRSTFHRKPTLITLRPGGRGRARPTAALQRTPPAPAARGRGGGGADRSLPGRSGPTPPAADRDHRSAALAFGAGLACEHPPIQRHDPGGVREVPHRSSVADSGGPTRDRPGRSPSAFRSGRPSTVGLLGVPRGPAVPGVEELTAGGTHRRTLRLPVVRASSPCIRPTPTCARICASPTCATWPARSSVPPARPRRRSGRGLGPARR